MGLRHRSLGVLAFLLIVPAAANAEYRRLQLAIDGMD
jgi:hypothetical protein